MDGDGSDTRDGAKRRGVSLGPQASQILQRLYEPNLGPGSPAAHSNNSAVQNSFSRPLPASNAVLKPKFQTRMKKNASVATIPGPVPIKKARNGAGEALAPLAVPGNTPLSTSASVISLPPGVMHPSLHKASERIRNLREKPHVSSTTSIRSPTLVVPREEDETNQDGGSYALLSPASKAAQRKALATESSFTASLNLDPRYLREFKSGNFLYLRKKKNTDLIMYALEVVEHFEVDRSDYYTMSMEGVTHFTTEHSEFWSLDKWETEYSRFMKMLAIPFFQKYKMWKNFNMWKQSVRTYKMRNAKKALNERLFLLAPSLQSTLLGLRALCLDVTKLELIRFSPRQTYSLRDFELEQQKTRTQVTQQLGDFSAKSLKMCVKACDEVIDSFLEANKISADHKMTFMERAALRKQCRTLTNFLRLADFLTIDATIQLTVHSFHRLYTTLVAGKTQLTGAASTAAASTAPAASNAKQGNSGGNPQTNNKNAGKSSAAPPFTAIFAVAVEMDAGTSALNAIPSHDSWNGTLQRALKEALRMVETPARHLGHESLAPYTTASAEDEGKDVWSVEQLNVALILNEDAKFSLLTNDIFVALDEAFEAVEDYMDVFAPFHQIYSENEGQVTQLMETYANAPLDFFSESIEKYKSQGQSFTDIPDAATVGIFRVDSAEFKSRLLPNPEKCILGIRALIPKLMKKTSTALLETLNDLSPVAFSTPSAPDAFVNKVVHMTKVSAMLPDLRSRYRRVYEMGVLMDNYDWRVPDDIKEDIILMKEGVLSLEGTVTRFEGEIDSETARFSQVILDSIAPLNRNANMLSEKLDHPKLSTIKTPMSEALSYLKAQEDTLNQLVEESKMLAMFQTQLKQTVSEFNEINEVAAHFELKMKLWSGLDAWQKLAVSYSDTVFDDIDVAAISKQVQMYVKVAYQAQKQLPGNEAADLLQREVDKFKLVLPVVTDLRSPSLKDRHWKQIHAALGLQMKGEGSMTLGGLIERNVMKHGETISAVAVSAQQEAVLEEMLKKVTDAWATTEFEVKPYKESKDVFVLGSVEEVTAKLDDSIVTISTIMGSRFIGAIQEEVEGWRKKLVTLQETLDEWLLVQKNWMYLENIFSAPDIQRQLPDASKVFSHVDASWKTIMRRTNENPHVLTSGTFPGIKETLQQHNAHLDKIQKNLEDYLETKRMAFPRFYFLSNDELLEILAQSKNPQAVQPHLRKCFENLVKLDFGDVPGSVDMIAMYSSENERVPLGKNLKARGNVEDWLKALEVSMKQSIYKLMKAGLLDYDSKQRSVWVCDHPGQVVATVAQMTWARSTEEALNSSNPVEEMHAWYKRNLYELNELIVKIRGDLSSLERKVIVALVTTDVHARDIIESLWTEKVDSVGNFIWQQQLRYYWDAQADDVLIRHSDSVIQYGYEYMGATSRLVITPLTDRCWMTLTGAYGMKLGAAPAGPAGTGKTESSKDLAKAMAIQCVVFNCSDQIDYKMMGKLFRGLAQAGNWTCLDEFNRIDIEVLSVVAQQLLILREGRIQGKEHINFMGIEILLKDHHVIVTMNPGYAGRTELPDNLKVCFRPVSMMVPDYALIAEIMLFAEGFGDARTLSRKMCKLYILCSEQLSQQPHYDYGLRAVKSVLVMAGSLKRANPDLNEDVTLIRALRDSNIPKFLADDLPLFHAIVLDLFPGTDIPPNDYGELQASLEEEITKAGLQKVPTYITKVIQLFDIFNVRFGGTLVGPTGAGKTSCYRTLQSTMTSLRAKGSNNPVYQTVYARVLNPKCISMGELYGEFNEATQEWHDGLASTIMREAVADETSDVKWTVFDGPIDALWIENMNTVLDDNMTLCLANGERIKLKNEMKMLFEVMDLAVASPATVSRIGVVYMTATDLGWMPFVKTWMEKELPSDFPSEGIKRLEFLITIYVEKCIQFVRKKSFELVPTVDMNLATSLCRLFACLFSPSSGVNYSAMKSDEMLELLDKVFAFSLFWSVGATMTVDTHEQFDNFARELMGEAKLNIPNAGLIFDYFVDVEQFKFRAWSEIVPKFQYNPQVPYFKMTVATPDSVRFTFLLRTLTAAKRPAYVTGVTGTGKTVIVQDLLQELVSGPMVPAGEEGGDAPSAPASNFMTIFINFSAQTSSLVTQSTIENKLEKKRKNLLGPVAGKRMIIFVDDVNLPAVEEYGAQAPIELLRQFLDFGGFYDRDKLFWKDIADTMLLAAAAPAGGGRSHCTPRFVRHFHVLSMYPAGETSLKLIFASILGGFMDKFAPSVKAMKDGIISCVIEIYNRVTLELLPTPNKFHYTFNLRDVSKVFQGILMITPSKCPDADSMNRLWVHEASRVFQDRLINGSDQTWFEELVCSLLQRFFNCNWARETLFHSPCPLTFGDFFKPGVPAPLYEHCNDVSKVTKIMDDFLENYNVTFANKMNLVFFRDAIAHLSRLVRILRQPRGNAMLIGVGGSGKQSLARLGAFMVDAKCAQIEITRGYGTNEFHEDLKKLMISAGVGGTSTVFLFTDSQIVEESFLEDINNVLNSGEVPNLFPQDEMDRIIADMRPILKALEIPETRDNCVATFIERVRNYLHIVLAMSPVGSALRVRCRAFPSLINCCTIDWYMNWPREALQSVADRLLACVSLPSEDIRKSLVDMCSIVHTTSNDFGDEFLSQLQRYVYTTPKSYLDLIGLYLKMLQEKRAVLQTIKNRMEVGVKKLEDTNSIVDSLKSELIELQPILAKKAVEAEELLKRVSVDQKAAAIVRERVSQDEATVTKQAEEVSIVQADAQKDLDVAMPALNNSIKALDSLSKNDITEVKSFAKPPEAVETVMNAVCLLFNEKQSWDSAKKILGDVNFLDKLKNFDKDNIPAATLKKLSKAVSEPGMAVEVVSKVSKAATSLCMWVHAMDVYSKVAKEVGPKKENLERMNQKLAEANAILGQKQEELRVVNENVAMLEKQCKETLDEKDKLANDAAVTEKRLVRAEKLISGLSVEGARWKESVASLAESILALIGDTFLAAACISYYGPFTGGFRQRIVDQWVSQTQALAIPCSPGYSLSTTLGSPVEIREWQLNGLPTDSTSTDNAILVTRGERWPLMIDPQGQANKWIKKTMAQKLEATKMTNANLLRSLETCIRNGKALLIEDIDETLEPSLEPILQKAIYKQGGRVLIRLGDSDVDYDPAFKLFLTTKLPNPHYLPEVYIKVTVINFTVTMDGLEDQLLGDVVRHERPDIEEKKNRLVVTMAQDKKQLKEIEDRILKQLSESSGNVLDDQDLIDTLQSSNVTSRIIKERVLESENTEIEINRAREEYRGVATRGSIIYFVVANLALIDPMYQYSLPFFQRLFNICFDEAPKTDSLQRRLTNLIDFQTRYIYVNICRGLFEVHKVLFSMLICCKILLHSGKISAREWSFYLRGAPPGADRSTQQPNPQPSHISEAQWDLISELETVVTSYAADGAESGQKTEVHGFQGLCTSLTNVWPRWLAWLEDSAFLSNPNSCPGSYGSTLTAFQKVLLLRGLAEEKVPQAVLNMISTEMGAEFGRNATTTMEEIYNDTDRKTPCIFVLSAGADPTGMLLRFAKEMSFIDRLHLISLGQGQGPRAEKLIESSQGVGDWVLLQNCHLAKSWMPKLEKLVEDMGQRTDEQCQATFRLFLTSFPAAYFPVTVLQNGIKLTNEPPKGIRANLVRSFNTLLSEDVLESFRYLGNFDTGEPKDYVWKSLLCALTFFHAIVQERRKFGALGWNIKYEFNDTDLETSLASLRKFLEEQPIIPWDALRYVTGQINYGGRVTDDWDRRCLTSILSNFYTPDVLSPGHSYSSSGIYHVPTELSHTSIQSYLGNLPAFDNPELFGMHENANVTYERNESANMMQLILSLEPRDGGGGGGKSNDQRVLDLAISIQESLPADLNVEEAGPTTFKTREVAGTVVMDSLATVLGQEVIKFNTLLRRMRSSLRDIQKAINGLIVMSSDLDNMYMAFLNGRVPQLWSSVSFASLKPLASWVRDMLDRVAFFREWLIHGEPVVFQLNVFFFPQGFMTGTLQNFARKYQTAIDSLAFTFTVMDVENAKQLTQSPTDGIYVDGLWLQGAKWSPSRRLLEDAKPGEMFSAMSIVHFLPATSAVAGNPTLNAGIMMYPCPVYKTSVRQGTLSTTGISTNYVIAVQLPSTKAPNYWVMMGAAFLLNLDN
ncbi:Dynein heavy chain 6, axonemal [Phytophthora fragariae]|uniref:Dynein heavy chain 6, axonemal n=1 Tax=Phytophthora fragariae TaxID=53985 RepID=A0A6G0M2V3_9STRA|nr:Dynein heavy chain 6, axonemal [Phytophthora fragariae]